MPENNSLSQTFEMLRTRSKMVKNKEASILRYSFNRSLVKILPIRLRLYAININPTSEPALAIPFFVRI
ncbi:MAG: hypothetical protein WAW07_03440 [Bacteroidales bacterium]